MNCYLGSGSWNKADHDTSEKLCLQYNNIIVLIGPDFICKYTHELKFMFAMILCLIPQLYKRSTINYIHTSS